MNQVPRIALALLASFTISAVAVAQKPAAKNAKKNAKAAQFAPHQVIDYKTVTGPDGRTDTLHLDVFNPPDHQTTDKAACIVFFFGGGWNGGTPSQFHPHCEYFASRGMVAISAQYRTKQSHQVTPKTCVLDGKAAIRWVREHATKLGIDPQRVAAGGGSAGGHVAAAVAACAKIEESSQTPGLSCVPNALVLFNPVYDNGPTGYGHDRVKEYWKDFSPLHNLHEGVPATIAFFGTEDKLIPVATTKNYESRMKEVGVRYDNHLYEGQGHGFFNYGRGKGDQDFFVKTVRAADRFLTSLGLLEGEPTIEDFVKTHPSNK